MRTKLWECVEKNIVQFECRLKNHVLYIISYSLDPNILPEYCKYTNKCTHTQGWEPALDIWSSIYYYCLPSLKILEKSQSAPTLIFVSKISNSLFFFLSKHITKWKTFWFLSYVVIVRSTLQFCFGFTFFLCFYLKSGHSVKYSKDKLMIINNFTAWEIYFMHSDYTFIGNISDDNLNETRRIGVIRASVYYGIALCLH